jgi:hypothetical protein
VVLVASAAAGMGMIVASTSHTSEDCSNQAFTGSCTTTHSMDNGLLYGGLAVAVGGPLLSLILIGQHDHADISVVPLDSAALRQPLLSRSEGASVASRAEGLALRFAF